MNKELLSTSDVWFSAFLMSKNVPIAKYEIIGRGRVKCFFEMTSDEWKKYKLEFNNSDVVKFKHYIDQLKDLSY